MAEIEKVSSPFVAAIDRRTSDAEGIAALARQTGGNPATTVELDGVTVKSDRVAVAAGAQFAGQLAELRQLAANASAGATLLDVADAGLTKIQDKLSRMDELAQTAALTPVVRDDGSRTAPPEISSRDRAVLGREFEALRSEIDQVATTTTFDGDSLLTGDPDTPGDPRVIDFGAAGATGEPLTISLAPADSAALSADLTTSDLGSAAGAAAAVVAVAAAQASANDIQAAIRGARGQLNSVESAAGETSAVVERVRAMKTTPETVVELSRVVAGQVTEDSGLRIQDGAQKLLQDVLLRMSAATANGGPAAGSDGVEEFGGKTAGTPAAAPLDAETPSAADSRDE